MRASELLQAWFESVWNASSDDVAAEFIQRHMTDPCDIQGLPPAACSHKGFLKFRQDLRTTLSGLSIEVVDSLEAGDRTMGICRVEAQAGGSPVQFEFGYSAVVENDRIVRAHNVVDYLPVFLATGALTTDQVAQVLGV